MIGCIIQARTGSSRLPKKVLEKINENDVILEYVLKQISYSKKIQKIVVATTNLDEDEVICEKLRSQKIDFFKGSSDDVLDRFFQCAKKFSFSTIVRITGDNPLIDPYIVDKAIDKFVNLKCDFVSNTIKRTFPYGTEVEVFSFNLLEKAWKNAKKPSEREHVTPFMYNSQNKFHLENLQNENDYSNLRYTVDKIEDLTLVKEIVKNINLKPILLKHIINLYKINPEIFKINENIIHDGYLKSLKKDEVYFKLQNGNES